MQIHPTMQAIPVEVSDEQDVEERKFAIRLPFRLQTNGRRLMGNPEMKVARKDAVREHCVRA